MKGARLHIPILLLLSAGCAPRRALTPAFTPDPASKPRQLRSVELALCEFRLDHRAWRRVEIGILGEFRRTLTQYLHEAADYGSITHCGESSSGLERVRMHVFLSPDHDTSRSWFLDSLFFFPLSGFWPVTPMWGRSRVRAEIRLETETTKIAPVEVTASAPFSVVFYSWYRTAPVEEAYRRAYDITFRQIARRVARRIDELVAKNEPEPPAERSDAELMALAMELLESEEIRLPEQGLRVIAEPIRRTDNLFQRYVGALGGVEASKTGGSAIVQSRAKTTFSGVETVGSGRAISDGFRFAFYRPPDRTGFFFPPRLGFFSQDIEISGFRQKLPLFGRGETSDIPAVVTDPTTGVEVDIDEPISYALRLKSGYLGQGIGFNFVVGTDDIQLFSTVQAAVNAFEVRHTGVTINRTNVSGYSAELFGSGQGSAQLGLAVPAIHLALRAAFEFEWFRSFDYPEPLEFQASVAFNPEKMVFERQRVFVDGATVFTFNWQLSAIYSF